MCRVTAIKYCIYSITIRFIRKEKNYYAAQSSKGPVDAITTGVLGLLLKGFAYLGESKGSIVSHHKQMEIKMYAESCNLRNWLHDVKNKQKICSSVDHQNLFE